MNEPPPEPNTIDEPSALGSRFLKGPAKTVQRSAGGWRDAFGKWVLGLPRWGRVTVLGLGVLGLALVVLKILSKSLTDWGLWGDLAFALTVTTAVLWALLYVMRGWFRNPDFEPLRFSPFGWALGATATILLGIPIAVVAWPVGTLLALIPLIYWAVGHLPRRRWDLKPPLLWLCALLSVATLAIFVALDSSVARKDQLPRALPPGAIDNLDVELASAFRPFLFFDAAEKRYPLDIEDAISDGRIHMCRAGVRGDDCPVLLSASEIDDNAVYLEVADAPPPPRGGDDGSAYYFHVTKDGDSIFIDYWWFYARNPSPVAGDMFCGPGFRFPPYTCQEHAGDWEGVTVEVGPCASARQACQQIGSDLLQPLAVHYGQHENVKAYAWAELESTWGRLAAPASAALQTVWVRQVLPTAKSHGQHPLIFVARNSHASYASPCFRSCSQIGRNLPEGRHDGGIPWAHNDSCDGCVKPLPLTPGGQAATWNAYSGRWGEQECILGGAYCDFSPAPRSPSWQTRYLFPGGS